MRHVNHSPYTMSDAQITLKTMDGMTYTVPAAYLARSKLVQDWIRDGEEGGILEVKHVTPVVLEQGRGDEKSLYIRKTKGLKHDAKLNSLNTFQWSVPQVFPI